MISCPRCSTMIAAEDPACPHCGAEVARGVAETAADAGAPPGLPHRYEVIHLLGRGGMGRVYLCRDRDLEVDVAVKILPPAIASDPRALQRIESEAKVAARLRGLPGILSLYGFERHGESCILVMEYAAGGSVFHRIRDLGKIPEKGCRRVGAEVADALALAHGRGVLHRDIKPGNVLLDIQGRVMVADFGLARVVTSAYAATGDAPIEGTPTYMPPEVIRGDPVDGRGDLYSLGVMLYEMATGEPPFRGTYRQIAAAKTAPGAAPPDPREKEPRLSREFADIVRSLMEPDPDRRIPGAAACATALRGGEAAPGAEVQAVEAVPVVVVPPVVVAAKRKPPAGTLPPPAREGNPVVWVAVAGVLLLGAVVTAFALRGSDLPTPSSPGANPVPGPAPAPGVDGILVHVKPLGATVLVDGTQVGVVDSEKGLLLTDVAPGVPHVVAARLDGHQPDEEKGVVWRKGEARAPVVLRLVPQGGILDLEGGRPGARVTVRRNGTVLREMTIREDGTLTPEILDAGACEVEVAAKGYRTWKQAVTITFGRGPRVRVEMPELEGFLSMDTAPTGAEVLLEGRVLGRTPFHDVRVPPGKHVLAIDHPDASPGTKEVEIRGEATTSLGVVPLGAMASLDLSGLAAGVSAIFEGQPVAGVLRRRPGIVLITFRRAGKQAQSVEVELKPGSNPLPALRPWQDVWGKVDLTGIGGPGIFLVAGARTFSPPWTVLDAPTGVHLVIYGKERAPLLPLQISVRSGETVRLPPPVFPAARKPAADLPEPLRGSIEAGLDWLRRHQSPEGNWSCAGFSSLCRTARCGGPGNRMFDTGVTGLSVLALLGARGSELRWDGAAAWRGIEWLVNGQEPAGNLGPLVSNHFVYNHATATLAVIEGYQATGSPWLRESARKAVGFILKCQNPNTGWRYGVRPKDSDTSVTVWMVEALRAAVDAGIPVDPAAFEGARTWLEKVTEPQYGRAGYTERGNGPARPEEYMERFPADKSESLTAGGVLARLACGARTDDEFVQKGLSLCDACLPDWDLAGGSIDFYYWYLGTRAQCAAGGPVDWPKWRDALVRALAGNQRTARDGDLAGSWDPVDPWMDEGGRVYSTAINVLALEVPWRRGPNFREPPQATTLAVASEPPGASVYLGDRLLGTTPLQQAPVPAGKVTVRFVHPEREDLSMESTLTAFQGNDLGRPVLPPCTAILDLSDVPRDALCSADGRELKGKCPVRSGEQRVTIARPGSWPQSILLSAVPGEAVKPPFAEWKTSTEWARAAFKGLPAPPAPLPSGFEAPPGTQVQDGRIWSSKDRAEMVLVPALEEAGRPPAPAFLVDRHEVTVAQFQAFCKEVGYGAPAQPSGSFGRHPVVNVDRALAQAYATWAGRRLPTIDEWERAAYGRPAASFLPAIPWPWGRLDQPRARNLLGREDGQSGMAPVASYPTGTSPCGCFDMVGNAAEWVKDRAPQGASCQTAVGDRFDEPVRPDPATTGFRCVLDLPAKQGGR